MALTAAQGRAYLALLGIVLIAVGGINLAVPPPSLVNVAQVISALLIVFGAIGLALTMVFGTSVAGLTNGQQAMLMFVSTLAISLSTIDTATFSLSGASLWYLQLILLILGVIGYAIKEAIGTVPPIAVVPR